MDSIKIYCKRVKYFGDLVPSELNFFNRDGIESYTGKRELTDIIDLSSIKYEQSEILVGDTLELVKKCNDINISVSTIGNDYKDYFKIKSNDKNYLYVFFIQYGSKLIFSGITLTSDISYKEDATINSEVITINIKTILNHFLEYYKLKDVDVTEVEPAFNQQILWGGIYKSSPINTFFNKFFFNNNIAFNTINYTGYDWEMNYQPFFHAYPESNSKYSFVKNGFRKMIYQTETKTDFFMKLCNAMGWDFYLTMGLDEKINLNIYNRSRTSYGVSISNDEIVEINYSTLFDLSDVNYIVIKDGRVQGAINYNSPNGIPVKIISLEEDYSNQGYFFSRATDYSGWTLFTYSNPDYYMVGNTLGANDILDYGKVRYTDPTHWTSRATENIKIKNRNILYIETGENTKGTLVDTSNKNKTPDADGLGESQWDLFFKGNYGSMLFYRSTIAGHVSFLSYDEYSRTPEFINNFKMLLKNKDTDVIDIVYNGILADYYTSNLKHVLFNTGDSYLDRSWDIIEVDADLINEQTKLKLKLITY